MNAGFVLVKKYKYFIIRDIVLWLFMKSIPIVSTHRGVVFCAVCWLMLKVGKIFPKRNAGHIIQPAVHGARRTARWLHNSRARCAGLRGAAVTLTQFFCRLAGGWLVVAAGGWRARLAPNFPNQAA